uniref:Homeobox domain-containing protein n=1 Tax=Ascaris lumbricoides TaxID=6252 RepID=A0A0M3IDI1_ASCLU
MWDENILGVREELNEKRNVKEKEGSTIKMRRAAIASIAGCQYDSDNRQAFHLAELAASIAGCQYDSNNRQVWFQNRRTKWRKKEAADNALVKRTESIDSSSRSTPFGSKIVEQNGERRKQPIMHSSNGPNQSTHHLEALRCNLSHLLYHHQIEISSICVWFQNRRTKWRKKEAADNALVKRTESIDSSSRSTPLQSITPFISSSN